MTLSSVVQIGNINLVCHMIRKQVFFIFLKLKNQCLSISFVLKSIYLINIDTVNGYIFNDCIHRVVPPLKCSNHHITHYKDNYDFCTERMIVQIAEHRFYPIKLHVVRSFLQFLSRNSL